MLSYREIGTQTYGQRCELCGYGIVEVHHVDYPLHTEMENKVRIAVKKGEDITELLDSAKKLGFIEWDGQDLGKDNRSTNLSCLCGNCHNLVHLFDAGLKLLKAIPKRK